MQTKAQVTLHASSVSAARARVLCWLRSVCVRVCAPPFPTRVHRDPFEGREGVSGESKVPLVSENGGKEERYFSAPSPLRPGLLVRSCHDTLSLLAIGIKREESTLCNDDVYATIHSRWLLPPPRCT